MIQFGLIKFSNYKENQENKLMNEKEGKTIDLGRMFELNEKKKRKRRLQKITMTAFHRPFRKLAIHAVQLSLAICVLYAHCWSRTLSLFKVSPDDGAGALCRIVFTPFNRGGSDDHPIGAHENSIWTIWLSAICIMILSFAQDEWNGLHCKVTCHGNGYEIDAVVESSDDEDNSISDLSALSKRSSDDDKEHPQDTLEMVRFSIPLLFQRHNVCSLDKSCLFLI